MSLLRDNLLYLCGCVLSCIYACVSICVSMCVGVGVCMSFAGINSVQTEKRKAESQDLKPRRKTAVWSKTCPGPRTLLMSYSPTAILRQHLCLKDILQYTLHLPSLAWGIRGWPPDSPRQGANKQVNTRGICVRLMATALFLALVKREVRRCVVIAGCRNKLLLLN